MNKRRKAIGVISIQRRVKQHEDIIAMCEYYNDHETMTHTLCRIVRTSPQYLAWRETHPVIPPTESPDDSAATPG